MKAKASAVKKKKKEKHECRYVPVRIGTPMESAMHAYECKCICICMSPSPSLLVYLFFSHCPFFLSSFHFVSLSSAFARLMGPIWRETDFIFYSGSDVVIIKSLDYRFPQLIGGSAACCDRRGFEGGRGCVCGGGTKDEGRRTGCAATGRAFPGGWEDAAACGLLCGLSVRQTGRLIDR